MESQNLNSKNLNKLRMLSAAAARMLTRTRKFDHISPVLQCLHWLPIHFRIQFVLHIKTSSVQVHGLSPPMATEPFTHVLLNSGTHFLQIYVFVARWIFSKRLTYLKLLLTVFRLLMIFNVFHVTLFYYV